MNKPKSSDGKGIKLILGDCLEKLKTLEDNSIDAIVTDPPYGLSFMGKKWDYDVPNQEIWEECLRVLKPGGYLLAFAGTRTQHRMAVRIEDAGFEIRDMIAWCFGQGFPKSLNIGKSVDKIQGNERDVVGEKKLWGHNAGSGAGSFSKNEYEGVTGITRSEPLTKGTSEWEGWGTALKPALEPISVCRKPLEKGLNVAQNCLKWGVGGINIDGCRVESNEITGRPQYESKGWKNTSGMTGSTNDDWKLGRFPANLIHDGSDEVVGLFPQTGKGNGGSAYNYAGKEYDNKETSMFNGDKPQAPSNFNDSGSAARYFYCAKASKSERNRGCEDMPLQHYLKENKMGGEGDTMLTGSGNPRDCRKHNNHPTVKPIALMEYLVKLVSKEGHTVLDPFMGSGSTGIACKKLGREFIGIEKEADYCKIAEARINSYKINPIQENLS